MTAVGAGDLILGEGWEEGVRVFVVHHAPTGASVRIPERAVYDERDPTPPTPSEALQRVLRLTAETLLRLGEGKVLHASPL